MPRYYFDMRHEDEIATDEEGLELASIESVQEEAARSLADMARDTVHRDGKRDTVHRDGKKRPMAIEVRDDHGPVLQARFTFEIERQRH
jgi:hypothetical protein